MRWSCLTLCALVLAACQNGGRAASTADTSAAQSTSSAPAPAPKLRLGDLAGQWKMTATNAANDSTLVTYEMTATADTSGWSISYPTHPKPIALRVKIDADSVVIDAGPYASTARTGAVVTIHGVSRLRDGKLVGTEIARYTVDTAVSVVRINLEGTRGY
ncbi:MAG TPA: hypothetical protein VIC24_02985 [Gemmatimonadaceae bacterium]|jgi:hypothetical protein